MLNKEQIVNKLHKVKNEKETTIMLMETYQEVDWQRVVIRQHKNEDFVSYHNHEFYEINYVLKGNCINLVEDETFVMHEGSFILMHPNAHHTLFSTGDCDAKNILISREWFENLLCKYSFTNSPMTEFVKYSRTDEFYKYVMSDTKQPELQKAVRNMLKTNDCDDEFKYLLLEADMIHILCLIFSQGENLSLSASRGKNTDATRSLIKYITNHYNDVTLDELAKAAGYSKTHICRLLKNDVGKGYAEILTDIRLTYAKSHLINTSENIRHIANLIGFDSVEYFQRLFRKKFGITPGEYRKKNKI